MAVAAPVISYIVQRLGDLLVHEADLLSGVTEQIEQMKIEMKRMKSYLNEADVRQVTDKRIRTWVSEIRNLAYDAEDILDNYICKVTPRRKEGLQAFLERSAYFAIELIERHKFGKGIQAINESLTELRASQGTYSMIDMDEGDAATHYENRMKKRLLRHTYSQAGEEDLIGMDKRTKELLKELTKVEDKLSVVSIVGIGGLGKTTLARQIYNHGDVKSHFDCRAWAFISEVYELNAVMQNILNKVGCPVRKELEEDLVMKLRTYLKDKRYLVVLDDMWKREDWQILKAAFPDGKKGSKILITTQLKNVASYADGKGLHFEPERFSEAECWELIRKKAFGSESNRNYPNELEKLDERVVQKCDGLPLAVAVIAGLLAEQKTENDRKIMSRSLTWHLSELSKTLALSYNVLPFHLKPCFLYLGLFRKDFEIQTSTLVHLWIAEGFIPSHEGYEMEDVGERYLMELVHRCMVQTGKIDLTGRVKSCHLHHLMHDLCVTKAKEEALFLQISSRHNSSHQSSAIIGDDKFRRIALHLDTERYVEFRSIPRLRTLLLSTTTTFHPLSFKFGSRNFRLLRVLDLEFLRDGSMIHEIAKLIHLKFLGLKNCSFNLLPASIGNLRSMQTLDLRAKNLKCMPDVIYKMRQLRHLHFHVDSNTSQLHFGTLTNLQTLHDVKAGPWIERDLGELTKLRKVGIWQISHSQGIDILNTNFLRSNCLESLSLQMLDSNAFPDLEPLSNCTSLRKLHLEGHIENIFQWPCNLNKLYLRKSHIQHDSVQMLQELRHLSILILDGGSYQGHEMICSAKGFPELKVLEIRGCLDLKKWRMEEGAMPCLRYLSVYDVGLEKVPRGLRFLTTLQILTVPEALERTTKQILGEDYVHQLSYFGSSVYTAGKLWKQFSS